jgi:undecaprenyl-diphosphatase
LDLRQSLVLGVVQGLTEFIPVSSTAHLIIAPELFGIHVRGEIAHTYDTFIQLGTVIPVLLYFWREWLALLRASGRILIHRRVGDDPEERLVVYLLLGSVPAGLLGLLLEKRVEQLADPAFAPRFLLIGLSLIVVGVLMWWIERVSKKTRSLEHLSAPDALFVGAAQALALFPGVSRSGSTITAGLMAGFTREAAARFSFLLMTPIMLAATGYKFLKMLRGSGDAALTPDEWTSMIVATVVAGISGYLAIVWLLSWLRSKPLAPFAFYRVALGAFLIGLYLYQSSPAAAPLVGLGR